LNVIIPQIKRVKIKTKLVHSGSEIPNLFHPMLERNAMVLAIAVIVIQPK